MPKKSFIEEELAREYKMRTNSPKMSFAQKFTQFLCRRPENLCTIRTDLIETSKQLERYGLILTPNETRAVYGYPTISDKPQSSGILVMSKLESTDGDIIEAPLYFMNDR